MLLRQKHILLATCLLAAALLSGCGGTPTTPTPHFLNPVDPLPAGTQPVCAEITPSSTTVKVGETITVTGAAPKVINHYYFGLQVKDAGADDFSMLVNVLSGPPAVVADVSQIVQAVSAEYSAGRAVVELKGRNAGTAEIAYFVSGEDYCGIPLGSGISPIITITVEP